VLVEPDPTAFGKHHFCRGLAILKWIRPQIVAVQLDEIEGI
jgi:hypothetical protein